MSAQAHPHITVEEYFRLDAEAESKSEYFDGEMYAMSGGSGPHAIIAVNLASELRRVLRHKGCTVASSDLRVRVGVLGRYAYPDVAVFCGEGQYAEENRDTLINPALLVEVLSQSSESRDRGLKSTLYRRIPTVREYLLVSQTEARVEVYTRQAQVWVLSEFAGLDGNCRLAAFDGEIPMSEIYLSVNVPPQPADV